MEPSSDSPASSSSQPVPAALDPGKAITQFHHDVWSTDFKACFAEHGRGNRSDPGRLSLVGWSRASSALTASGSGLYSIRKIHLS